jgi:phenylpyruvate tautomerase PptA (4-oxalocrotonate tautomerase family)
MPMIDVYAQPDTFAEPAKLAQDLAATLMEIEGVPAIPMFRDNTAAFVHTPAAISNVAGQGNYVRVQVLTNAGALDRDKQLAVVARFTEIVAAAASGEDLKDRVWVLLTETYDGGWGLWGHAHTNEELVAAARAEIGRLQQGAAASTDA